MTEAQGILVLVGIPAGICAIAGIIHGWKASTMNWKIWLGAFIFSGITCWSSIAGGGDMPLPALVPAWLAAALGPFAGSNTDIYPPWWLSPWLPFAAYLIFAFVVHRAKGTR